MVEVESLGIDQAIPCALIVSELVTNSIKYAFPDHREGTITIGFQRVDGEYRLEVADDGIGLPAEPEAESSGKLGMKLVLALVDQLEGKLEVSPRAGARFMVTFPAD